MTMNKLEIGATAGIIWEAIEENGPMLFTDLKEMTGFDENQLSMALGWLSREDKIFQANPFEKNWELYIINV